MSDIHAPRPARPLMPQPSATPEPDPVVPPIDLPTIEEPEMVAPLVLAIAEQLTDDGEASEPKKAQLDPSTKVTTKTVEIKISLPAMPNLSPITQHRAYTAARIQAAKLPRKKLALGSIVLAIALFIIGGYLVPDHDANVAADPNTISTPPDLVLGTPNYAILLPEGKTLDSFKGATWINSSDRNPVFVYIDKIDDMKINVSQQPLPDDFQPDTVEKIAQLAKAFGANEKITVDDTVVYIGTSEKSEQSVIFNKNDLLILMKSSVRIDNNTWAEYINSLQ